MEHDLTNPTQLAHLLQSHGLHTQKGYGQHFLISQQILDQTIQAANIQPTDTIIEVGTGVGVLTKELAKHAKQVIAFEIDQKLAPILAQTLADFSNIDLHFQDFLQAESDNRKPERSASNSIKTETNLAKGGGRETIQQPQGSSTQETNVQIDATLAKGGARRGSSQVSPRSDSEEETWGGPALSAGRPSDRPLSGTTAQQPQETKAILKPGDPFKFVSNLPYNVGSHILDVLIKSQNPPQSITVLLQKEVAQKIAAQPPHATYLSNFVSTYGQAHIVTIVPPTAFFPPPAVDSALLHIQKHSNSSSIDTTKFSKFLHRGFAQPRKMLNKSFTIDQLAAANINPNNRPENLTLTDWQNLYYIANK